MATMLVRVFDAVFIHPRGVAGRIGGALMARANAPQERWAAKQANLVPGERVLVVGPGPGVGLALAASEVEPGGRVIGVEPSATMREMAADRCASQLAAGRVELRDGTAERTGCVDTSMDAVISVNNVMLWDRPVALRELHRVLKPGGRLVLTVHRHVLDTPPEQLRGDATAAGFTHVDLNVRARRCTSPAIELVARRPPA